MERNPKRCDWAQKSKEEQEYHDHQWGIPLYDDKKLFKMLVLEGMQAGLSWRTILNKMDALCEAFDDFRPEVVVHYDEKKEEELLRNEKIIRNRLKIKAVSSNARAYFRILEEFDSFSSYLWSFVGGGPIINTWEKIEDVPCRSEISDRLSRDLKERGFKFVGSIIVYSFMQAVGMVNDHLSDCDFRRV